MIWMSDENPGITTALVTQVLRHIMMIARTRMCDGSSNCMPEISAELILTLRSICRIGATRLGP